MDSKVVIVKGDSYDYCRESPFRPSKKYPETPYDELSHGNNEIYSMVRTGFRLMEYDIEHYGTKDWNPLGQFISPGNTVVLKPNMVMDENHIKENGTDCLYTQPSVVAAVLDYVVIALHGKGKIIVGDAPMQECKFDKLVEKSGYLQLICFLQNKLKQSDISISLVDFRELRSLVKDGVYYSVTDRYEYSGEGACIVNLGDDSEFAGLSDYVYDNIRITNYDPALLKKHHNSLINEYKVSREILSADVIINMPKPKVHRKGGVTIALKNLVGINCRKEYLPHHTNGSKEEGGDEYFKKSWIKRLIDKLLDKRNHHMQTTKNYLKANLYNRLIIFPRIINHFTRKDVYFEGSWYGNDTISRTLVDLNKILLYADKHGCMQKCRQRKMLIVADMVISGEKEGPVDPSPKKVGMISIGEDPVCFDEAIATLMGAKLNYIHSIKRARNLSGKYTITDKNSRAIFISNVDNYNLKHLDEIAEKDLLYYIPSSGWKEAFKNC